jgi:uroporphyrin-III C-methyltransferase
VLAGSGGVGIPLTHRDHASSVTVVTGHESPDKAESSLDWDALADTVRAGGTLVILMGVGRLAENVERLRARGVDPETGAAMVEKVTWTGETTVTSTLDGIVGAADEADIEPPAVTIIGDVVTVREGVLPQLARGAAAETPDTGDPDRDAATGEFERLELRSENA